MKKRIFVLRKFVKRAEKIILLLVFEGFRFTEISYHNFPLNENVRKLHLYANAYSWVNMKLCRIVTKASDFSLVFRSTFPRQY